MLRIKIIAIVEKKAIFFLFILLLHFFVYQKFFDITISHSSVAFQRGVIYGNRQNQYGDIVKNIGSAQVSWTDFSSEFRFEVIRNWYAKCRMNNSKDKVLRNPSSNVLKRRKIEISVSSPRKGM